MQAAVIMRVGPKSVEGSDLTVILEMIRDLAMSAKEVDPALVQALVALDLDQDQLLQVPDHAPDQNLNLPQDHDHDLDHYLKLHHHQEGLALDQEAQSHVHGLALQGIQDPAQVPQLLGGLVLDLQHHQETRHLAPANQFQDPVGQGPDLQLNRLQNKGFCTMFKFWKYCNGRSTYEKNLSKIITSFILLK